MSKKPRKSIGIICGMGALAGATFYKDVIDECFLNHNAQLDNEYPRIYLINLPVEGFSERGFEDPRLVKSQLLQTVKNLECNGSEILAIACNTVHYFYKDMQKNVEVPIVNIIEETAKDVASLGISKVGIISSESTRDLNLYEKALKNKKVLAIHVTDKEQKEINRIILNIMGGKLHLVDEIMLKIIILNLQEKGAEGVIVGCTELPLITRNMVFDDIILFDSMKILAKTTVNLAYNK